MVPRLASPKPFTPRTAGVLSGSRVPGQPRTQRGAVSLRIVAGWALLVGGGLLGATLIGFGLIVRAAS